MTDLTQQDFEDRIKELSEMEEGWLDGYGLKVNENLLEYLKGAIQTVIIDQNLPIPYLYPVPDTGGIQMSWDFKNHKSLEIFIDPNEVFWDVEFLCEQELEMDDFFIFEEETTWPKIIECLNVHIEKYGND